MSTSANSVTTRISATISSDSNTASNTTSASAAVPASSAASIATSKPDLKTPADKPEAVSTSTSLKTLTVIQDTENSIHAKINNNDSVLKEIKLSVSRMPCSVVLKFKNHTDNQKAKQKEVKAWIASHYQYFFFYQEPESNSSDAGGTNVIKLDCMGLAKPLIQDLFLALPLQFPDIFTKDMMDEVSILYMQKLELQYPESIEDRRQDFPIFGLAFFYEILNTKKMDNSAEISKLKDGAKALCRVLDGKENGNSESQALFLLALVLEKKNKLLEAKALFQEMHSLEGQNRFYPSAQAKINNQGTTNTATTITHHYATGNTAAATTTTSASTATSTTATATAKRHNRSASLPSPEALTAMAAKAATTATTSPKPTAPPIPAKPSQLSIAGIPAFNTTRAALASGSAAAISPSQSPVQSPIHSPVQSPVSSRPASPSISNHSASAAAATSTATVSASTATASMNSPQSSPRPKPKPPASPPPNKSSANKPAATRIQSADSTPAGQDPHSPLNSMTPLSLPPAGRAGVTRARSSSNNAAAETVTIIVSPPSSPISTPISSALAGKVKISPVLLPPSTASSSLSVTPASKVTIVHQRSRSQSGAPSPLSSSPPVLFSPTAKPVGPTQKMKTASSAASTPNTASATSASSAAAHSSAAVTTAASSSSAAKH